MRAALGVALVGAACMFACGSSSSNSKGGSAGMDNSGGGTDDGGGASGKSGTGGKGNHPGGGDDQTGEGGEAGSVETPVVSTAKPHAAEGLVAGGVVAHSAHFTGVFSLGAAPGGNGVLTSPTRQLRGGVLGASQK